MTKHTFKVGDRFRFVRHNSDSGERFGREGEEFVVHDVRGTQVTFTHPKHSFKVGAYPKDIEFLPDVEPSVSQASNLKANFSIPREILTEAAEAYVKDVYGVTLASAKLPYGTALVPLHAELKAT